jgi:hypothetical protein
MITGGLSRPAERAQPIALPTEARNPENIFTLSRVLTRIKIGLTDIEWGLT